MKLTLKIILLFLIFACGLVGVSGYLSVQREIAFFEEEMSARHVRLANAVHPTLRQAWSSTGHGGMLQFVASIEGDEQQVRIRWVWLDGTPDPAAQPVAEASLLANLPANRLTSIRVRNGGDVGLFCSYYPIALGDGRLGALEMSESLVRRDQYTADTITRTVTLMAALILAAVLLVGIFGLNLIGRPLQALIEKTQQVAEGDLKTAVEVRGHDELSMLADALNQMCEKLDSSQQAVLRETAQRIEAMEQLRHGDRLKTVGRLASGVAHELGTPLNVITGRAGLIAGGKLSQADVNKSAAAIQSEANRMTAIVQQLLNFARRSSPNRTLCDLNSVLDRTVLLLEPIAKKHAATVNIAQRLPDDISVSIDAAQMQQVFSNLVMNALLSKDSGVAVEIAATVFDTEDSAEDSRDFSRTAAGATRVSTAAGMSTASGASAVRLVDSNPAARSGPPDALRSAVRITFTDNGCGINPDDLPHVFEPFFTTRDVGQGTGLGLSIAHGIVTEHGGWMTVDSVLNEGTVFTVYLPIEIET